MPKKRLTKRQEEYLSYHNIYINAKQDDPFYNQKRALAKSLKNITDTIATYDKEIEPNQPEEENPDANELPPDVENLNNNQVQPEEENHDVNQENLEIDQEEPEEENAQVRPKKKLTPEEIQQMITLYQKAINSITNYISAIQIEIAKLDNTINFTRDYTLARQLDEKRDLMMQLISFHDDIARTLSKDYIAFLNAKETNAEISIEDIFESSRVNSTYSVKPNPERARNKGNQNERIPVSIYKNNENETVDGYFTPDNKFEQGNLFKKYFLKAQKKFGKDANFIKVSDLSNIYNEMVTSERNGGTEKIALILSGPSILSLSDYDKIVAELSDGMSDKILKYIDTPKKLNIFLNVAYEAFKAQNLMNINESVGIDAGSNINRRNAAMSKMSELLGCSDLIAHSENMKLTIDGTTYKGTFMKNAVGSDLKKLDINSLALRANPGSANGLNLKKQIANLQILDYICGNPDRHAGNLLYNYVENEDGTVSIESIQGIDNDTSFGTEPLESVDMSAIPLTKLKVITREMQETVMNLTPEKIRHMFYGYQISTDAINGMINRVKALKKKITEDLLKYEKGYSKGYLITDTIKVVDDNELNELSIEKQLVEYDNKPNLFTTVYKRCLPENNISQVNDNLLNDYKKSIYDASLAGLPTAITLVAKLNKDNRLGGSSTPYNNMLASLKALKEYLYKFNGPVIPGKKDPVFEQSPKINELKEKYRQALIKVNEYIIYKDTKKKGEEWRNIKEPHAASRTERRYHDAIACRKFLNEQLDKFEKIDAKFEKCREFDRRSSQIKKQATRQSNWYRNSDKYSDINETLNNNLYNNHVSRSKYYITSSFNSIAANSNDPSRKAYCTMKYDMYLGFTVYGVKPSDKKRIKDELRNELNVEIPENDEDLLRRATAAHMITTKAELNLKHKNHAKNPVNPPLTADETEIYNSLIGIKIDSYEGAVDRLMETEEFKKFFDENKRNLTNVGSLISENPSLPTAAQAKRIYKKYSEIYLNAHPELKPPAEEVALKKVNNKKSNSKKKNTKNTNVKNTNVKKA